MEFKKKRKIILHERLTTLVIPFRVQKVLLDFIVFLKCLDMYLSMIDYDLQKIASDDLQFF